LVHFRFPERYCRDARDGVGAFFERPRPNTRQAQPIMEDPEVRPKTKDKIKKVIRRRNLLPVGMLDVSVKLFIKYFAVLKGKDNIPMAYNATTNKLNKAV
jgi:hypothetical protein